MSDATITIKVEGLDAKSGARHNSGDMAHGVQAMGLMAQAMDHLTQAGFAQAGEQADTETANEERADWVPDKALVSFGGDIKALPNGHLGGYLVRFSSADDPDLTGDYFTKSTDFGLTPGQKTPVYFHHRMPLRTKSGDVIVIKKKIGEATLTQDDTGVLIDAILFNREQYEKDIAKLAKSLGWSSGTAAHLVERELAGKAYQITAWPLGLDASLTPTPAEPRNAAITLKAYVDSLPPAEQPAPNGAQEHSTAHYYSQLFSRNRS